MAGQHLDSDEALRQKNRVPPIHRQRVERLNPRERRAVRNNEGTGPAHIGNRIARLYSTEQVPFAKVLMLDRDTGNTIDSPFV